MKTLLFLGTALALAAGDVAAQGIAPSSPFVLNLDYARFRNDDNSGYLEVYYGFYPNLLTYERSAGEYRGGVDLTTRIINQATGEVIAEQESPLQIEEPDTSGVWYRYPFVSQAGFVLPFGSYRLEVMATDQNAPSRQDSVTLELRIEPYSSQLDVSDLELCKNIKASDKKGDLFYKNSLEVVPNPSLVFGIVTSPVLFHYSELYNLTPGDTITLRTQLLDDSGIVLRQKTKQRAYASRYAMEVGSTPLTSFPSGKYHFRCEVLGKDSTAIASTEKWFFIYSPHLQAAPLPSLAELSDALEKTTDEELTREFELARYLATDEEITTFSAITSVSGKRDFLVKFWASVARGRREKPPISRAEYLRRVEVANEKFTSFGKEGWLTDRGRVYILYSDPDEIERFPGYPDSKAYQIWHYFSIENGVEFVFIDRSGYGDYQLVHSTKRGELNDELWQRFLR